jgi:hypothetical protein
MGLVKEVADAIATVSEGIDHITTVAKAVRDGVDYVKTQHPEIKKNLQGMCVEMRNTTLAIAVASSILTQFKFTVAGSDVDKEPARFNNYLIAYKEKAATVDKPLQAMRGHCHVICKHVQTLQKSAQKLSLNKVLLLLGISSIDREKQVLDALQKIYDEEMQSFLLVNRLTFALRQSLSEVSDALGPGGQAKPQNVPKAAALLNEYSVAFAQLEAKSNFVALELQGLIDTLE